MVLLFPKLNKVEIQGDGLLCNLSCYDECERSTLQLVLTSKELIILRDEINKFLSDSKNFPKEDKRGAG